jgi:hypothetical protein
VPLTLHEREFVEKREKFARSWPLVGSVLLLVVFLFGGWLWLSNPFLIDPWAVSAGLKAGVIPASTVALMAALLPVAMLTSLFVLVVCLLFAFVALSNERKQIAIIQRLALHQDAPEGRRPG